MEGILLDALEAQAAAYEERSKANLHLKETTSHMMLKPAQFIELWILSPQIVSLCLELELFQDIVHRHTFAQLNNLSLLY